MKPSNLILAGTWLAVLCFASAGRAETQLLKTWRYSPETPEAAATGTTVVIPHTWNATDIQAGRGTNQTSTDGYRRAASWYATALPVTKPGKRVFVHFGAVSSVADVS